MEVKGLRSGLEAKSKKVKFSEKIKAKAAELSKKSDK